MSRSVQLFRALWAECRATTITEFGFLAVPVTIVLLGGIDLGYQSYVRAQLQGVLNNVARQAVVETPDFGQYAGSTIEERIENAIEERVDAIARNAEYDISQTSFYDFSSVGNAEKLTTDVNGNGEYDARDGDCFQDANRNRRFDLDGGSTGLGGSDDVVFYEVTITMPRLVPMATLVGAPENYTIRAQAAVRNQPFGERTVPRTICGR